MQVAEAEGEDWLVAPLEVVSKLQGELATATRLMALCLCVCVCVCADEGGSHADCGVIRSYFTHLLQSQQALARVRLYNTT